MAIWDIVFCAFEKSNRPSELYVLKLDPCFCVGRSGGYGAQRSGELFRQSPFHSHWKGCGTQHRAGWNFIRSISVEAVWHPSSVGEISVKLVQ